MWIRRRSRQCYAPVHSHQHSVFKSPKRVALYGSGNVHGIPPTTSGRAKDLCCSERRSPITVTTSAGTTVSPTSLEIYPKPWYRLDYGFNMSNTAKRFSYPWRVWENGDLRRAFGNDVNINTWVGLGIPYWTPWDGWDCLGYLVEEPIAPDPLGALFYGAGHWYIARNRECFGFSGVTPQLYHDQIETYKVQPGVYNIDDFVLSGALREGWTTCRAHGSPPSACTGSSVNTLATSPRRPTAFPEWGGCSTLSRVRSTAVSWER